ncbi:MAG TPA: hypothetical protein VNV88_07160 [Candidatus Solibacter sp.]|nr:hypothetical protein [Candidatus Solibacter sp.]
MTATTNLLTMYRKSLNPALEYHGAESGRMRARAKHGKIFLTGERVLETGIYEVIHDRRHRPSHEVVMHAKDLFPACDQCHARVRFKLVRTAPYIFDDEDFVAEP